MWYTYYKWAWIKILQNFYLILVFIHSWWRGWTDRFIPFSGELLWSDVQTASFRVWTWSLIPFSTTITIILTLPLNKNSVCNLYGHFRYLKNQLQGLDVTCQPIRGNIIYAWTYILPWGYSAVICHWVRAKQVDSSHLIQIILVMHHIYRPLYKAKIAVEIPWIRLRRT